MHNLLQAVEWSNQKCVGPGLQVYELPAYAPETVLCYQGAGPIQTL